MPSLFHRRVIAMGHQSLVFTLPRSWCLYLGLQAGDRLEVIANGELIVRPLPKEVQPASTKGTESVP